MNEAENLPQALVDRSIVWWRNLRISLFNNTIMFGIFFLFVAFHSQFHNYYSYEGVPDTVLLARTLYHIPNISKTFPELFNTPYYFAQYQYYPIYLRIFIKICFFDSWLAVPLSTFFQNILSTFSFFYMLSSFNIVYNYFLSSYVFITFPLTFILQKNLALPTSLCFSFECLAFAFLKQKKILFVSIFCLLATLISFQGIIVTLSILSYFIIKKKLIRFLILFLISLLTIPSYMFLGNIMYGDKDACFKAIFLKFSNVPFSAFYQIGEKRPFYLLFGTFLSFLLPSILGTIRLYSIATPLFIYCLFSLFFIVYINVVDFEKYFIGLSAFAVIIGFDDAISFVLKIIRNPILLLFYEIVIYFISSGLLHYHLMPYEYSEYSMNIQYPFIDF